MLQADRACVCLVFFIQSSCWLAMCHYCAAYQVLDLRERAHIAECVLLLVGQKCCDIKTSTNVLKAVFLISVGSILMP